MFGHSGCLSNNISDQTSIGVHSSFIAAASSPLSPSNSTAARLEKNPTPAESPTSRLRRPMEHPASQDRISELPDEMLRLIISFLPTKSGTRTTILSQRWRPLWCSVPLKLKVDDSLAHGDEERLSAVSQILAMHPGPVRMLTIRIFGVNCYAGFKLNEWFQSPALAQLEYFLFQGGQRVLYLPVDLPRVFPTLQVARFVHCRIPSMDVALPLLNLLILTGVGITNEGIERLLECCPALERLHLDGVYGL